MTLDDALRDLAATGNTLPREAMQWSLDHWDEAAPRFTTLLDGYASGIDRSERTERALFLVIHLLGDKGETAAFAPLCRLLLDAETSDLILGDAITTTLCCILISTYGGDPAPLQAVIEAENADDFVRQGALLALAYLVRTGRTPGLDMRAYLLRLLAEMKPQAENFVWLGWMTAVAVLGYEGLAPQAEELFHRGLASEEWQGVEDFRGDLERTLRDPDGMAGFEEHRVWPFTGAIEELSKWHGYSGKDDAPSLADYEVQQPITNPLRGIGRNDPCPCGSGRKYKKCCLV